MGRLIGRKPIEININSPQGGHLPIYDGNLRIWGTIGSSSLFSSGGLISGSQQVYLTGTTGYNEFSASYTDLSSSFLELSSSFDSATFQGSFIGDGTGLYNVPFSGVTSLAFFSSSVNVKLGALEVESGSIRNNFNSFTSSYRTGSFTGSFKGDGTLLSNIPASGVTGLQLNQIIDGSATASISQLNGLRINVDSEITGSLSVSETISSSFIGNGSGLYNIPATGVTGLELNKIINGNISASLVNNALRVNTDLYVDGTITAKEIHVEYVSSSVLYESGSTKFGDSIDDIHSITGSVLVDGKVNASSLTGSINFTNLTNVPTLVSGSSQIEITGTTGYSTFSGSIASTDLSQNNRLNSIEGVTGSYATTGSNVFIGNQTVTGSLIVTNGITGSIDYSNITNKPTLVSGSSQISYSGLTNIPNGIVSGSSQIDITGTTGYSTFSSSLSSSIGSLSASFASTDLSQNNRLNSIEGVTGSYATTGSNQFKQSQTITGSLIVTGTVVSETTPLVSGSSQINITGTTGYSTFSSSLSSSIGELSSSVASTNLGQNNRLNSIEGVTGSYATTGSNHFKQSQTITGSLIVTGTIVSETTPLVSGSSQIEISGTTGYSTFSSSLSSSIGSLSASIASTDLTQNNRLNSIEGVTGSYATTGSNHFKQSQVITGSLTVTSDVFIDGIITAREIHTDYVTSSVLYQSGSTRFGNSNDDKHEFTGSIHLSDESSTFEIVGNGFGQTSLISPNGALILTPGIYGVQINGSYPDLKVNGIINADGYISSSTNFIGNGNGLYNIEYSGLTNVPTLISGSQQIVNLGFATTGSNTFIGDQTITGSLSLTNSLIVSSSQITNKNVIGLSSGTQTISTTPTASYTSAFYNYTVLSGSNARTGQIMVVWNGSSLAYTDNSTTDIGTTGNVALTASLSTGNVVLSTVLPTNGWTIKSLINLL